jgi:hypothetical protein
MSAPFVEKQLRCRILTKLNDLQEEGDFGIYLADLCRRAVADGSRMAGVLHTVNASPDFDNGSGDPGVACHSGAMRDNPMNTPSVNSASAQDRKRVISAIVLGFVNDPIARWSWPDPHAQLPAFSARERMLSGFGAAMKITVRSTAGGRPQGRTQGTTPAKARSVSRKNSLGLSKSLATTPGYTHVDSGRKG